MEAFLNNSRLFKIHLVQSERDIFGNPISSDERFFNSSILRKKVLCMNVGIRSAL